MGGGSSLCASRLRLGKPPRGVGRRRRAVPTTEKGGASRLGAAALFVSRGRGAAPSGALTSGDAVAASRRWGAAPAYALRDSVLASRREESDGVGAPSLPPKKAAALSFSRRSVRKSPLMEQTAQMQCFHSHLRVCQAKDASLHTAETAMPPSFALQSPISKGQWF